MNLADPEDRAVACAEFVLGTLDEADRARLIAAMENDESLQQEVGFWQDRLLGLYGSLAPTAPSADLWHRIDAALDREPARTAVPARPAGRITGPPLTARGRSEGNARFWERLRFWQGLSGLAVAAAVFLALLVLLRPAEPPAATYVAVLQGADRQAAWMVTVGATGPVRLVPLTERGPIPQGKSWELWTKGVDATAPTSLGLLRAGPMEIPREALPYLGNDQLFEVTLEPEGGSPTGRPTGTVLSIGTAQRI